MPVTFLNQGINISTMQEGGGKYEGAGEKVVDRPDGTKPYFSRGDRKCFRDSGREAAYWDR